MTYTYIFYCPIVSKSLLIVMGTLPALCHRRPNCSKLAGLLVKAGASLTSARHLLALFRLCQNKMAAQAVDDGEDCPRKQSLQAGAVVIDPAHAGNPSPTRGTAYATPCLREQTR